MSLPRVEKPAGPGSVVNRDGLGRKETRFRDFAANSQLCDLGQIPSLCWASISSFVKQGNVSQNTFLLPSALNCHVGACFALGDARPLILNLGRNMRNCVLNRRLGGGVGGGTGRSCTCWCLKLTDVKCFPAVSTRYPFFALRQLEPLQDLWKNWSLSQKGENGRELSLKPEKKNSYGEEGFYVIFAVERGWTETNRWILQEDFDLIEELNASHRWPAVEWIASKGNELPVEGGVQVLDDSPFQLQSVWFWVVILNLFDWLTFFVCSLFLTPPSPQPTSSGSKASGSECDTSYKISPWLSCEPSFSRTLEWPIWWGLLKMFVEWITKQGPHRIGL